LNLPNIDLYKDIYTIISLPVLLLQGLYYLRVVFEPLSANIFSKYMSWRKFNRLIKRLAEKIKKGGRTYSMIVAAGRGGAICAGCLSSYLGSIPVLVLDRKYIAGGNVKTAQFYEEQVVINSQFSILKRDKILLLSQQSDPGITLTEIAKVMRESGFTDMDQCAVLKSEKTADTGILYWAKQYAADKRCKKFPWEKNKGYKDIMKN